MKHRLLALLVSIALLLTPLGASAEALPAAAQGASLAMQYGGASSLSYAVYRDGQIVTRGTVSAAAPGEVQDAQPLYGVGSVSKVYTAAAVMKLCEAGLLTLDTPVADALPNFSMDDPRYADITVRMLLNHASGLMFAGMRDAFLFGQTSNNTAVSSLLGELRTQRLIADPGAYSVYCNTGFTLAQLVAEEVSGMPLHDYPREAFFAPLGLADTFAAADDFDRARLAPAYLPADNRPVSADCVTITGTGGLYATAEDLARFGGMLAGDGDALTDGSRAAMAQPEYARGFWPTDSEDDALSFGLGWDMVHMFPFNRSGVQALCKGGDTNLYHAGLVVLPEYGMAAAVLSSGGLSTYNQLLCARLLIDELAAQGVIIDESAALPAAEPATMPEEMTAYSGVYAASTGAVDVQITPDGALTLTMGQQAGGYQQLFVYCADGTFRDATGTVLVRPETAANGQTSAVPAGVFPRARPDGDGRGQLLWHAPAGKRGGRGDACRVACARRQALLPAQRPLRLPDLRAGAALHVCGV